MLMHLYLDLLGQALVVRPEYRQDLRTAEVVGHLVALGEHLPELRAGDDEPVLLAVRAGLGGGHSVALHAVEGEVNLHRLGLAPAGILSKMWCASNGP